MKLKSLILSSLVICSAGFADVDRKMAEQNEASISEGSEAQNLFLSRDTWVVTAAQCPNGKMTVPFVSGEDFFVANFDESGTKMEVHAKDDDCEMIAEVDIKIDGKTLTLSRSRIKSQTCKNGIVIHDESAPQFTSIELRKSPVGDTNLIITMPPGARECVPDGPMEITLTRSRSGRLQQFPGAVRETKLNVIRGGVQ